MDGGTRVCGIILAAGAGTRFGGPKALAHDHAGRPWLGLAVDALREGGCDEVVVVLGAGADAAASLVPSVARITLVTDREGGLSHSLRVGLKAAVGAEAAVIIPVDTPTLPSAAVARVIAAGDDALATALRRATYRGLPGHPVLLGATHWAAVSAEVHGDSGAGSFLTRHGATAVECADLWSGEDRDRP